MRAATNRGRAARAAPRPRRSPWYRAITKLGLRGVALCTHVDGVDLDDSRFAPVFAAAENLGVPAFLHPQNAGDIRRIDRFPARNHDHGHPADRPGLFERHPVPNVVLAHGGGYLPYQLGRLDRAYKVRPAEFNDLPKPPSSYLHSIYCDSLTHDQQALRFLLDRIGIDHVVLGTDYPFGSRCDHPVEAVEALGLPPAQQADGARRHAVATAQALRRAGDLQPSDPIWLAFVPVRAI
ncbi:MAG TPA: amidohydrolase family protein [Acetobacteraceae bacterium]